jgi:hypothetical protein
VGLLVTDSVGALAGAGGIGLLLLSFDDPAACAAGAFFLDDVEVLFPLFEDVAHAGANSNSAQLPSRQF